MSKYHYHYAVSDQEGLRKKANAYITFLFHFAPPFPRTLVAMLQSRGTAVYLISGGFRQLIEPFAKYLGIPKDHIFANRILFNEEGMYINIK